MELNKPRFTVIICAYNVENYIERAINSVLSQDYKNYELIISDDCSTDNTMEIIKKYINENVKLVKTPSNTGTAGGTRNAGLEKANGEYIIFLDGDDTLYDENVLKNIDKVIGQDTPDIVYLGFQDVGQGNKERISTQENSTKIARLTCDLNFSVSSRCWNKEFLDKNNMRFVQGMYYEDEVFCIKGTILSKSTKYSSMKVFKYYRNRKGSVMSTPSVKKCSDWYRMLAEVTDLYSITPKEYKPYLLSFIKNENDTIPARIAAILKSMECGGPIERLPKRNYKFKEFFDNEN